MSGYLQLITGPMFSGKSTRLLYYIQVYKEKGLNVFIVKPSIDNRYSTESKIVTHNGNSEPCVSCVKLEEIADQVKDCDVIIIEEGQFFEDLYKYVVEWCETKKVHVAGLNGCAKKQLFGDIYKLLPHVDDILFLTAQCKQCQEEPGNNYSEAIFSKKTINNNKIVEVGAEDLYRAVCRKHFQNSNLPVLNASISYFDVIT
jgi:thymidine kinase